MNAFQSCSALTSASFAAGSQLSSILLQNSDAMLIAFPAYVWVISVEVFAGCNALKSFEAGSPLTSIDTGAFQYSGPAFTNLLASVANIGDHAISVSRALSSVDFDCSATYPSHFVSAQ
jgi:hypothetical protein